MSRSRQGETVTHQIHPPSLQQRRPRASTGQFPCRIRTRVDSQKNRRRCRRRATRECRASRDLQTDASCGSRNGEVRRLDSASATNKKSRRGGTRESVPPRRLTQQRAPRIGRVAPLLVIRQRPRLRGPEILYRLYCSSERDRCKVRRHCCNRQCARCRSRELAKNWAIALGPRLPLDSFESDSYNRFKQSFKTTDLIGTSWKTGGIRKTSSSTRPARSSPKKGSKKPRSAKFAAKRA